MTLVASNGIRLNAVVDGSQGRPWITFIGGITNDYRLWDAQVPALSNHWRLLRLDTRGHGGSESSQTPYSLDLLARDVLGCWDALGIERSCVAGLGLGGVVAAEIAFRHPERVSGLVPVS